MNALDIQELQKIYPSGTEALKGISFSVEKGDFFALLGPNGAGKSTTINIICSLVNKSGGEVKILGHDLVKDNIKVKSLLGLVPQEFNFSIFEKVIDVVVAQAGYYGMSRHDALASAEKLPYPEKSFDLVISINSIHNLPLERLKTALKEIRRVCRGSSYITIDAWRNEIERENLYKWVLTAETMMHVNDWKKLFLETSYTGDYWWFIAD